MFNYYPQVMQPQTSNVNWIYVNGIKGAKEQMVRPGEVLWMMDNNNAVIYAKSADMAGAVTLKAFDINERSLESLENDDYVSKTEFVKMSQQIEILAQNVATMLNELGGVQK